MFIKGIRKLNLELGYLIIPALDHVAVLLTECLDQSIVALLPLLGIGLEEVLESRDVPEVLCFLELNAIPLKIGILDPLSALSGKGLDALLLLFVESNLLLRILKQRDDVIVLLRASVQLSGHGPQLILQEVHFILQ